MPNWLIDFVSSAKVHKELWIWSDKSILLKPPQRSHCLSGFSVLYIGSHEKLCGKANLAISSYFSNVMIVDECIYVHMEQ